MPFNAEFLEAELQVALNFSRIHRVPIICDQWGAPRTVGTSRLDYARDVLALFERHRVSWALWEWRQRSYSPWAVLKVNDEGEKAWMDEDLLEVLINGTAARHAR